MVNEIHRYMKPLIVQADATILLEVESDPDEVCRNQLARFAELIKSPEHIHTYRVTPLAIWNAASSKMVLNEIMDFLWKYSKYDVPSNIITDIRDWYNRYGQIKLLTDPDPMTTHAFTGLIPEHLYLYSEDVTIIREILARKTLQQFIDSQVSPNVIRVTSSSRGRLKQSLIKIGFPVEDLVGFVPGDPLNFMLKGKTRDGSVFTLRKYQEDAASSFLSGGEGGRNGIIVLPSGSGKTAVGMRVMEELRENTLIITTGTVAVRQWIKEILDKSNLDISMVGEYTGDNKEIMPVTVTTYQVLTYSPRINRESKNNLEVEIESLDDGPDTEEERRGYPHLEIFRARNWGVIIYDEVHLLPAPVFRITSEIQAKKRLGLTATLVREDGKEDEVFSLIGPKKFDVPWKDLEKEGWIATARCYEVRVNFPDEDSKMSYAVASQRNKYRIAAENPNKFVALKSIISGLSPDDSVLIIGDFIGQLERIASELKVPIITGKMRNSLREDLYSEFREGKIRILVVSKVANYAIDLPDANVAIQISGTFGSRQEEAQRLGRLLRPKKSSNFASFYSIITRDTIDQDFSMRRQLFLTERGYQYVIIGQEDLLRDGFMKNRDSSHGT